MREFWNESIWNKLQILLAILLLAIAIAISVRPEVADAQYNRCAQYSTPKRVCSESRARVRANNGRYVWRTVCKCRPR